MVADGHYDDPSNIGASHMYASVGAKGPAAAETTFASNAYANAPSGGGHAYAIDTPGYDMPDGHGGYADVAATAANTPGARHYDVLQTEPGVGTAAAPLPYDVDFGAAGQ